jgi:hypothetical protein
MKAFKIKTAQIAKNYSRTYNVKIFSSFIKKNENSTKRLSIQNQNQKQKMPMPIDYRKKSAMLNVRNSLKCFIAENMKDLKKNSNKSLKNNYTNSLFAESKREEEEPLDDTKKNDEKFDDTLQKIINTTNSCKTNNNNMLNIDEVKQKSHTMDIVFKKENKSKSNIENSKIIHRFSANLTMNKMDQNQANKILIELRNEINKRNNYLRLFNESNEKINTLYSQLVNNTIDIANHIDKIGILDTQIINNLDINKIVLNNINSDNILAENPAISSIKKEKEKDSPQIKSRSSKKNKKSNKKMLSSLTMGGKSKTKFKNKEKKPLSKFDKKNKSNVDQVFINLNQPVLIFNSSRSIENKEKKDKDETFMSNKSFTNKNSFLKENLGTIKNNKENQNDISSFISDISHNSILKAKIKGKI